MKKQYSGVHGRRVHPKVIAREHQDFYLCMVGQKTYADGLRAARSAFSKRYKAAPFRKYKRTVREYFDQQNLPF